MDKSLEELLEFRKDNKLEVRQKINYHIVCVLENFEKRIKVLEQDYPNEKELKKLRREGID